MKENTFSHGFSMLEIAVVLIIASVVLVSLLPVLLDIKEGENTRITMQRLARIETALQHFADTEGRLPCPADMTLPPKDPDFAKEGGADDVTDGDCSSAAPSATWSAGGSVAGGMVPTRALHLPDEYAFDGEGVRFAYHVSENLTAERGVAAFSCSGGITVQDQQGNDRTTSAAYVLLSHGRNASGSYGPSGTQRATESTNDGEQDNYGEGGYDATFRQSSKYMQDTDDPLSQFDDIVLYKERYQLFEPFRFDQVMTTHWHACGLSNYGRAYCWGKGDYGNLGNGATPAELNTPQRVFHPSLTAEFVQLSVGDHHTCALDDNGAVYCWGRSGMGGGGQIGDNTTSQRDVPTQVYMADMPIGVSFDQVSAGEGHSCALATDGEIYCWGWGDEGEMGTGVTGDTYKPQVAVTRPAGVNSWKWVDAGMRHSCAIGDNNQAYCWGRGTVGELGDGLNASSPIPVLVSIPAAVNTKYISAGGRTTCAISVNGGVYCWGEGTDGQIGDGNTLNRSVPTLVALEVTPSFVALAGITSIEPGRDGTCATADNGSAYCWGLGDEGEIGEGASANRTTATLVNSPTGYRGANYFEKVYNGNKNACGFNDNWGYCWGSDEYGKIGDGGTNTSMDVPTPLSDPNDPCPL